MVLPKQMTEQLSIEVTVKKHDGAAGAAAAGTLFYLFRIVDTDTGCFFTGHPLKCLSMELVIPQQKKMAKSYTGHPPTGHKPVQNMFETSLKPL